MYISITLVEDEDVHNDVALLFIPSLPYSLLLICRIFVVYSRVGKFHEMWEYTILRIRLSKLLAGATKIVNFVYIGGF